MNKPRQNPIHELFGGVDGAEIPGGCDHCDAYQTVTITDFGGQITVHHDDWCPVLRSKR